MILQMFCIRDRVAGVHMSPFFLTSVGQAIRSFSDEVNRSSEDNQLFKHPDDFELYHLGAWENENAKFEVFEVPVCVMLGKSARIQAN